MASVIQIRQSWQNIGQKFYVREDYQQIFVEVERVIHWECTKLGQMIVFGIRIKKLLRIPSFAFQVGSRIKIDASIEKLNIRVN